MDEKQQDWRERRRQERWQRRRERWERRREHHHHHPWGGAVFGLLMILGGGLFLLRNLGFVFVDDVTQYWPVILIGLGLSTMLDSGRRRFPLPGLMLVGLGGLFLARNLGYIHGNIGGYIVSVAIIALGISMLMRSLYGPDWWGGPGHGITEPAASDERTLRVDTVFGAVNHRLTTQEFEGGKISAVFSGVKIDLRNAGIQKPEVELAADSVFGGIEIFTPLNWQVEVRGSGVFGGYEDHTHKQADVNAPKLIVKGSAVFGGVVVRN